MTSSVYKLQYLGKKFVQFWMRRWIHGNFHKWQENIFQYFLKILHQVFRAINITKIISNLLKIHDFKGKGRITTELPARGMS